MNRVAEKSLKVKSEWVVHQAHCARLRPQLPGTAYIKRVLAVQLALVVVVGAARATAPVADPGWVPGLASRLDGQHEVLGEAGLLCRRR